MLTVIALMTEISSFCDDVSSKNVTSNYLFVCRLKDAISNGNKTSKVRKSYILKNVELIMKNIKRVQEAEKLCYYG